MIAPKITHSIRRMFSSSAGQRKPSFALSQVDSAIGDVIDLLDLDAGRDGAAADLLAGMGLSAAGLKSYRALVEKLPVSKLTAETSAAALDASFGKGAWKPFFSVALEDHPVWSQATLAAALIAAKPKLEAMTAAPPVAAQFRAALKTPVPAVAASPALAVRQPTGAEKSLREVNRQFDAGVAALRPAVAAAAPEVTGADRVARDFNRQFSRNSKPNTRP